MIPILYEKTENNFTTYGIGALSDVVSCVVSEERNGQYELIMTYPISGKQYGEIQAERIIKAKAKPLGDDQLFRVYRMSKPIRGIVTIYAQHISYDLSGDVVLPFSGTYTTQQALNAVLANTGFTGHTDKSGSKTFGTDIPKSSRSMLGGTEGSVLDQWGGEYKWDNFDVYLNTSRGMDKDVVIEYGKNLTELVADHDLSAVYSELLPYATYTDDSGSHTVTGDPISITSVITRNKTLIKDFTYEFEGPMTKAQVNAKAASWLSDNPLGYETPSLTVSFINLPAPANYPAAAATIDLCDTVTIRYTALGVNVKAKVVSCEYDTLLERYTRLTIGKPRASMADTVANLTDQASVVADYPALWKSAIEVATQMITGNAGGNVVLHEGPDGKPFELLIMDDPDITQATKVWRWTLGGLGYSTNGYAGPYALAITADGKINADFIRAGRLVVSDSSSNILFDADIATNKVTIAGFTVVKNMLQYKYEKASGSGALASKTNELRVNYGNNGLIENLDYWALSGNTLYSGSRYASVQMAADNTDHMVALDHDHKNNPSSPYSDSSVTLPTEIQFTKSDANGNTLLRGIFGREGFEFVDFTRQNCRTAFDLTNGLTMQDGNKYLDITASGPTPYSGYNQVNSMASGTAYHTITSFSLDPGTYLVQVHFAFATNTSGRRVGIVSYSQDSSSQIASMWRASAAPVNGENTFLNICGIVKTNSTTTYYLNAMQNSGSGLNTFASYIYVRLA